MKLDPILSPDRNGAIADVSFPGLLRQIVLADILITMTSALDCDVLVAGGIGRDYRDVSAFHAAFRAVAGSDFDFQLLAHALRKSLTALAIWTEHGDSLNVDNTATATASSC